MASTEEADPAERPRRGSNPRLKTADTLVAIPEMASGGTAHLLNLSTMGACVEIDGAVERGQALEIKLAHPKLMVAPLVKGEVAWFNETATKRTRVGLRFLEPSLADPAVRPFLTAEAGSCLFQEDRLVGFVVPHGKAKKAWSLFEASGKRLAVASKDSTGYQVHAKTKHAGTLPSFHVASLYEATCKSIGVEEPLRLDPPVSDWRTRLPIEPKSAGETGRRTGEDVLEAFGAEEANSKDAPGRVLRGPAGPLGFLCETSQPNTWLVVDQKGKQVAYLSGSDSAGYQICSMGDAIDDELDFGVFQSLDDVVAAVFQLEDSTEDVGISKTTTVGRIAPMQVSASDAPLDLAHAATQITLTGYSPPQRATKERPKKQTKEVSQQIPLSRRILLLASAIAALVLGGYVLYALWSLILTYTS